MNESTKIIHGLVRIGAAGLGGLFILYGMYFAVEGRSITAGFIILMTGILSVVLPYRLWRNRDFSWVRHVALSLYMTGFLFGNSMVVILFIGPGAGGRNINWWMGTANQVHVVGAGIDIFFMLLMGLSYRKSQATIEDPIPDPAS